MGWVGGEVGGVMVGFVVVGWVFWLWRGGWFMVERCGGYLRSGHHIVVLVADSIVLH